MLDDHDDDDFDTEKGDSTALSRDESTENPVDSESGYPFEEEDEKSKLSGKRRTSSFSATIATLPSISTIHDPYAAEITLPPIERRSTVSTLSAGRSEQTTSTELLLQESGELAPIVAVPIPTVREPVDAVAVSIVPPSSDKLPPSKADKRRSTAILCGLVVAAVILISAVVAGVCGTGGCSIGSPEDDTMDDVPLQPVAPPELDARTIEFFSYINNVTFGKSLSPYENDASPEVQALKWLIEDDPLQLELHNNSFRIRQRYALATFWFHSDNTGEWYNASGWLDNEDECTWYGISCTNIDQGPESGRQMTVTSMVLKSNGIKGIFPSDFGLLSNLQNVSLISNQLQGSIPESIGQWTDLELLELGFNGFMTGQIPESIGNLHRLVYADFSFNIFTGQWPSSIGNWTNLVYLDFSENPFNTSLPSTVGNWESMEYINFLNLNGDLHGSLPESVGNWGNIQTLLLGGNSFSGTLPSSISNWTNARFIDLGFNEFSGTIPEGVGNWTSVEHVYLYETELTGSVPAVMCKLSNLTELQASCETRNISCSCCTSCF